MDRKLVVGGCVVVLMAVWPLVLPREDILTILFLLLLFVAMGQSWNIAGGFAGQTNLGYAGFFGLGALTSRLLWFSGIPFPVALVVGGVAALVAALVIGIPVFRLRGPYFICATLALAEIMRITVSNVRPGISSLPAQYIAGYDLASRYWWALALAAITMMVAYLLANSKPGLAMIALREDQDAAQASGVNILKYKLFALGLSSLLAGMAGGVFSYYHVSFYLSHAFFPTWTFDAINLTIIGGLGTVIGPVIGAVFYIALREVMTLFVPAEVHVILFGILFILVVLYMPKGLVDLPGRLRTLTSRLKAKGNPVVEPEG